MKSKLRIYLDWNIFSGFLDGNFQWLEDLLLSYRENFAIPFSSDHVEEATKICLSSEYETKAEIKRRLNYLSKISDNLYFVNDMVDTGYKTETPENVYQTQSAVFSKIDFNKFFSGFIDYATLKDRRKDLNLDSNTLNNVDPKDAILKINEILLSNVELQKSSKKFNIDLSFDGILKKALEISEACHRNASYYETISNKNTYDLNNFVVMSFALLDVYGFWSDKKSTYVKGSQFSDSRHAFNAMFMDLLISNDKRFCMKAKAVYSHLNIGPEVCFLKEDKNKILDLISRKT